MAVCTYIRKYVYIYICTCVYMCICTTKKHAYDLFQTLKMPKFYAVQHSRWESETKKRSVIDWRRCKLAHYPCIPYAFLFCCFHKKNACLKMWQDSAPTCTTQCDLCVCARVCVLRSLEHTTTCFLEAQPDCTLPRSFVVLQISARNYWSCEKEGQRGKA